MRPEQDWVGEHLNAQLAQFDKDTRQSWWMFSIGAIGVALFVVDAAEFQRIAAGLFLGAALLGGLFLFGARKERARLLDEIREHEIRQARDAQKPE